MVRIHRQRYGGRRLSPTERQHNAEGLIGDLQSVGMRIELHEPLTQTAPIAVLFDARLVVIQNGVGGMLMRGFEEHKGVAVMQEWEILPLEITLDANGVRRWIWQNH